MDASQYTDYVLVLLFIKYVSDKYVGQPYAPIEIPPGASFKDMVALKGKPDIGDQINKRIVAPLVAILFAMDAKIAALETKLAKAGQLKQGMMQELLTGRIRLV